MDFDANLGTPSLLRALNLPLTYPFWLHRIETGCGSRLSKLRRDQERLPIRHKHAKSKPEVPFFEPVSSPRRASLIQALPSRCRARMGRQGFVGDISDNAPQLLCECCSCPRHPASIALLIERCPLRQLRTDATLRLDLRVEVSRAANLPSFARQARLVLLAILHTPHLMMVVLRLSFFIPH